MPGLFSRYGALGNPVFDLLGAAEIGAGFRQAQLAAQKQAMAPDPLSQQFANQAALTGQMVGELPRAPGLFSNIGQALHLIGPTVAARPKDYAEQIAAIQAERAAKLTEIGKELNLRKEVGNDNFNVLAATPAMRDITKEATGRGLFGIGGVEQLDLSALTPAEAKTAALEKYRQSEEMVAQKRIEIATLQLGLMARREARMSSVPKLGTPEYDAAIARATTARTIAGETAKDNLYESSWDHYDRVNKGAWQYYDKKALSPINKNIVKTPRDAANDPVHYKQVNAKGADIMNKINDEINRSNAIINDVSVMFPDTRNMGRYQKGKEILKWAASNKTVNRYNKDVIDFKQLKADIMQYIRELQQRYPTAIELKQIGEGSFPNMWGDGREDAIKKMTNVITSLRVAADATTSIENAMVDDTAAKADYNRNTYGYEEDIKSPTEPESPASIVPEGMAPPPAGYFGPDETPGDVMGGGTP